MEDFSTTLREQLGLRADRRRIRVQELVVDSASKTPVENLAAPHAGVRATRVWPCGRVAPLLPRSAERNRGVSRIPRPRLTCCRSGAAVSRRLLPRTAAPASMSAASLAGNRCRRFTLTFRKQLCVCFSGSTRSASGCCTRTLTTREVVTGRQFCNRKRRCFPRSMSPHSKTWPAAGVGQYSG